MAHCGPPPSSLLRYYFCNDVQNQLVECNSSGLNSIYENTTWPNGTWVTVMHPLAGPPTIDEWLVDVFIEGEVADFMLDAAAQVYRPCALYRPIPTVRELSPFVCSDTSASGAPESALRRLHRRTLR